MKENVKKQRHAKIIEITGKFHTSVFVQLANYMTSFLLRTMACECTFLNDFHQNYIHAVNDNEFRIQMC